MLKLAAIPLLFLPTSGELWCRKTATQDIVLFIACVHELL